MAGQAFVELTAIGLEIPFTGRFWLMLSPVSAPTFFGLLLYR